MQHHKAVLIALACAALTGCTTPDAVLFVTDTSIGINVETKPPTVSVAYDRTEGFVGPRYDNGAIPPVVASLQTGGNVFNPKIRQVYATGTAAVRAVGTPNTPASPVALSGGRAMAFFGTSTTIGFKAGYDAQTGTPDSLVFGYRRKEFSYIPLHSEGAPPGTPDAYASVLASIDSNTATSGTIAVAPAAPAGSTTPPALTVPNVGGITSTQFYATGLAADTLATNPVITSAFGTMAEAAATSTLSPEDRAKAIALGDKNFGDQQSALSQVIAAVTTNGLLDQTKLKSLIAAANVKSPGAISGNLSAALQGMTTTDQVQAQLSLNLPATNALAGAISS